MNDGDGTVRRDAALTVLVLAPVTVAAVALDARLIPAAVVLGAGGTVLLEGLLSLRAARVRAVWADRRVQLVAVVVAVGGGLGLTMLVGPWVLTALCAGLWTYLVLLAVSVAWRRRNS
jgi:hypothetical protein